MEQKGKKGDGRYKRGKWRGGSQAPPLIEISGYATVSVSVMSFLYLLLRYCQILRS